MINSVIIATFVGILAGAASAVLTHKSLKNEILPSTLTDGKFYSVKLPTGLILDITPSGKCTHFWIHRPDEIDGDSVVYINDKVTNLNKHVK